MRPFADRRLLLRCHEAREPCEAAAAEALDAPAVQEASERPEPAEGLAHL